MLNRKLERGGGKIDISKPFVRKDSINRLARTLQVQCRATNNLSCRESLFWVRYQHSLFPSKRNTYGSSFWYIPCESFFLNNDDKKDQQYFDFQFLEPTIVGEGGVPGDVIGR